MFRRKLLLSLLAVLAAVSVDARKINVNGSVTIKGSNEPASGASIIDANTERLITITGEDGRFNITVESDAELMFSHMTAEDHTENVNDRHILNIELMPTTNTLEEVVITARGGKSTMAAEPTDLDLEGNTLRFKTKVKIPSRMNKTDVRTIVQPAIYNVSRKHLYYLHPIVFDGWRYALTQERMDDWNKAIDPLTPYQQIKTDNRGETTIYILDSLFVDNPKDDFMGIILTSLEDYNRIAYTDTFEIARGTVNPFRFLNYTVTPVPLTEERFIPTPEVELRDTKGEVNLVFPVGKSNLDLSLGNNAAELSSLIGEFKKIEASPDMALKGFAINGFASPDGRRERNQQLASARMKSALETILQNIDPSLRRNAEVSSHADVATWEDVVTLLRADGLNDEADKVQKIIDESPNADYQSARMTRLPFYKSFLAEKYLPRLRRVNYNITSSIYRPLTDEEIEELYNTNPSELTKYQFYRYYSKRQGEDREKALRLAVAKYPDFTAAATDLSEIMLNRGEDPTPILEDFFVDPKKWNRLPESMRLNMGIASMAAMRYSQADSILSTLDDTPQTHKAKIYSAAQNGRYLDVVEEISEDSPLNEVLVLLAAKNNNFAWEKAKKLGDSAIEQYVKAIAANRLDKYLEAGVYLNNAIALDPSLREIAKIDGDVVDLLEETDITNSDEE